MFRSKTKKPSLSQQCLPFRGRCAFVSIIVFYLMREYTAKEEGYVFMLCRCWCLCEGLSIRSPTTILKLTCYQLSSCRLVNQHTCLPHNTNLGEGNQQEERLVKRCCSRRPTSTKEKKSSICLSPLQI